MHIYVIKVGKEASKHLTENAFCDRFYSKREREREREIGLKVPLHEGSLSVQVISNLVPVSTLDVIWSGKSHPSSIQTTLVLMCEKGHI